MTKKPKDWTDEERAKWIDSYEPSLEQLEQDCHGCGGKGYQEGWVKDGDQYKSQRLACMRTGTPDQIWHNLRFLLNQFISCGHGRDTLDAKDCDGCMYERDEIASIAWHYAQAVAQSKETRNGTDAN